MSFSSRPNKTLTTGLSIVNNELYLFDSSRTKVLSVSRKHAKFSTPGNIDRGQLRHEGVLHRFDGYSVQGNSTITKVVAHSATGSPTKQFELRVNGINVLSYQYTSLSFSDETISLDIDDGDRIQVVVLSVGGPVRATNHIIELALRQ